MNDPGVANVVRHAMHAPCTGYGRNARRTHGHVHDECFSAEVFDTVRESFKYIWTGSSIPSSSLVSGLRVCECKKLTMISEEKE